MTDLLDKIDIELSELDRATIRGLELHEKVAILRLMTHFSDTVDSTFIKLLFSYDN